MGQFEMLFAIGLELLGGSFQQSLDFAQGFSQGIVPGQIAEDLFAQFLQLFLLFLGEFFDGSCVHGFVSFLRFFFAVGAVHVTGGSSGLDILVFFTHFFLLIGFGF